MGNALMVMSIIIFLFVLSTIGVTSIYLKYAYDRAIRNYNKKQNARQNYYVMIKDASLVKKVKNNFTKLIDTKLINEQIGYAKLVFIGKGNHLQEEKMCKDKIHIGRAQENDIVISDVTVSRKQCLIYKEENKFFICNLSGTNRTLLNGMPIYENEVKEIKYGDIVEIGGTTFKFSNVLG